MTLKTKFLLLTCAFVLLALLISEWMTIGATNAFLTEHAHEMEARYGGSALTKSLQVGRQTLLDHLVLLHLLVAAATVALLVSVLHFAWKRLVEKRLTSVLRYMSWIERGTWQAEVPDTGSDEIAAVVQAANRMGSQITTTTQQFGDASKLAALALIGQTLVRDVAAAHDQLCATLALLKLRQDHSEETLRPIIRSLDSAIRSLENVPVRFQREFDSQFQQSATSTSLTGQGRDESGKRLSSRMPRELGKPNARTVREGKQGTQQ